MLHLGPDELAAHYRKATRHLAKRDATLKKMIAAVGPCKLQPAPDHFRILARSIISQQISTKAAASIADRLMEVLGKSNLTPKGILNLSDEQMRAAGLSAAKVRYLRDLAAHVDGRILRLRALRRLEDEEVIEQLIQVKGIGRWTAEMFLMFSLGRPDVLPIDDLGFRSAVKRHYLLEEMPKRDALIELAECWRPYRSIATWYLWRSLALPQ
ncbi:MAG TPA: DNA-3-methyladenine glycosylase [Gemmataceae bacterium]|jgi:DNA-3-methyladenine glycosylase II|nr:DNA-3-methyladenine glycosylase [Gemmataceae bacterium]